MSCEVMGVLQTAIRMCEVDRRAEIQWVTNFGSFPVAGKFPTPRESYTVEGSVERAHYEATVSSERKPLLCFLKVSKDRCKVRLF